MKTYSSEFGHDYDTYSFGYCNYAIREPGDRLAKIYASGYLPYSGKAGVKDIFYMARSARVDLSRFSLSSENRRIAKRFDGTFEREEMPLARFDTSDKTFLTFCLHYFRERHGQYVMPKERLRTILDMGLASDITMYRADEATVAYVLEVRDAEMAHFWYSFYDLSYVRRSLGMWLMLDALRQAKAAGKTYFYIGTVYGDKALYKVNFSALEYWDGCEWIADVKRLKTLARSDS